MAVRDFGGVEYITEDGEVSSIGLKDTWLELLADFATMIASDERGVEKFFIDIDILKYHMGNASAEMGHMVIRNGQVLKYEK